MSNDNNKFSDEEILNKFGPIEHYNALIFNKIVAKQADCEGALAIGGEGQFGSTDQGYQNYSVGAAGANIYNSDSVFIGRYHNSKAYPSLLFGGKVSPLSTSAQIYAGRTILRDSYKGDYLSGKFRFSSKIEYVPDAMVDEFFKKARTKVDCISEKLNHASTKKIVARQLRNISQLSLENYLVPDLYPENKVVILNVDTSVSSTVTLNEFYFNSKALDYDAIIINIPAKKIQFKNGSMLYNNQIMQILPRSYSGNKIIQELASRLVFHFPYATDVELAAYAVIGSVMAPHATITTSGGSINGMLIADSFYQYSGMETHAFLLALGGKFWLPCTPPVTKEIKIIKLDSRNPQKTLAGAVFSLYKYNQSIEEYDLLISKDLITSKDGVLLLEKLYPGKYKLIETRSPSGYELPAKPETFFEI